MSGMNTTDAGFADVSQARLPSSERVSGRVAGFMHPDQVVGDPRLTVAEKREVLASWASDARAVPDAPTLRQLDNGAVVRVTDVLAALGRLDGTPGGGRGTAGRRLGRLRRRISGRVAAALWRHPSDDDDEPPPCPALVAQPGGGPLAGGAAVCAGVMLAA